MDISLSAKFKKLKATVHLPGSKSISNRALIIRALSETPFEINNLSLAEDTSLLNSLLQEQDSVVNAGHAGTVFRFLTAFLALQPGNKVLTGSDRMKERPIAVLVDALRQLGAGIEYLEKENYPPLKIIGGSLKGGDIEVDAGVSSQFISALLMIGPVLENGLRIKLKGETVSEPYILMTTELMRYFGAVAERNENEISILPGRYKNKEIDIEPDWSAASYWYEIAAFSEEAEIFLPGLKRNSLQGDSILADIYPQFGVNTFFDEKGVLLKKMATDHPENFEFDFTACPDLAQTVAVTCAGLGINAKLSGLKTLRLKETDRILALSKELEKTGVNIKTSADHCEISGKIRFHQILSFCTYQDHRMAMAFAPLALLLPQIIIQDAGVVIKSYPDFWENLKKNHFEINQEI